MQNSRTSWMSWIRKWIVPIKHSDWLTWSKVTSYSPPNTCRFIIGNMAFRAGLFPCNFLIILLSSTLLSWKGQEIISVQLFFSPIFFWKGKQLWFDAKFANTLLVEKLCQEVLSFGFYVRALCLKDAWLKKLLYIWVTHEQITIDMW